MGGQMSLQGFNWASLKLSVCVFAVSGTLIVVFNWVSHILTLRSETNLWSQCAKTAPVMSKLLLTSHIWFFYGFGLAIMFSTSTAFHVFMLSKLHAHDLRCYSGAVAETLEHSEEPLPFMKELEDAIGDRFHRASQTWVVATVRCMIVLGLSFIFLLLQLFAMLSSSNYNIFMLVVATGSCLLGVVLLGAPMASVSETFEHDVLRGLNTPLVLKHAQTHLGEQLPSHLRNLQWGFRVGGTDINMRLLSSVIMTALTSIVAITSQAVANQLS